MNGGKMDSCSTNPLVINLALHTTLLSFSVMTPFSFKALLKYSLLKYSLLGQIHHFPNLLSPLSYSPLYDYY